MTTVTQQTTKRLQVLIDELTECFLQAGNKLQGKMSMNKSIGSIEIQPSLYNFLIEKGKDYYYGDADATHKWNELVFNHYSKLLRKHNLKEEKPFIPGFV